MCGDSQSFLMATEELYVKVQQTAADMATSIKEVDLSDKRLQEILSVAKDWAFCTGAITKSGTDEVEAEKALPAPYSLFPSVVPAPILEHVKSTMTHFNRLMHKVSMDHEFLEQSLKNVIQVDPFMLSLWNVYCKVRESGIKQLPDNNPVVRFADGLVKAWELYGNPRAVIIFVVSASELNVVDQRFLEIKVYDRNPNIRILRKTFLDIYNQGHLDDKSRLIMWEWDARLKCELSRAIKCPSVQLQLTGAKKIQQELTRPGALERFVSDPQVVNTIRDTFADQYSLDLNQEGDAAVKLALQSPEKFVLKPQREGGGNNLYNEDITNFFKEYNRSKERSAYILMQKIFPLQQKNYLVKPGVPLVLSDVVSELGVYGVYIGCADSEVVNVACGHMLKTKIHGTNEASICAGFAGFDIPLII
ncbi:glutathione synthetase-like [Aplysia californica]|uniref:Glutathione synthetase n=1 Tax=Aplysia californica TaxID=6500 RepID=A0ABM1VUR1_APLCA|nr:glutathione synthetase-like [Aplysia californica]